LVMCVQGCAHSVHGLVICVQGCAHSVQGCAHSAQGLVMCVQGCAHSVHGLVMSLLIEGTYNCSQGATSNTKGCVLE
jgi:hypothetical protein